MLVEAGGGSFPLALERQLVGQHRGARLSLQVPYPADYPSPGLAGKTAVFEVEIKDLRAKELPAAGRRVRPRPRTQRIAGGAARRASAPTSSSRRRSGREARCGRRSLGSAARSDTPSTCRRRWSTVAATPLLGSLDLRLPDGADGRRRSRDLREQVRPRAEREVRAELILDAMAARDGIDGHRRGRGGGDRCDRATRRAGAGACASLLRASGGPGGAPGTSCVRERALARVHGTRKDHADCIA